MLAADDFAFEEVVERACSLLATGVAGAAPTGVEATGRAGAAAAREVLAVPVGPGTRAAGRGRTAPLAVVEFTAPEVDFAAALAVAVAGAAAVDGAGAVDAAGLSAGCAGAPVGAGATV